MTDAGKNAMIKRDVHGKLVVKQTQDHLLNNTLQPFHIILNGEGILRTSSVQVHWDKANDVIQKQVP